VRVGFLSGKNYRSRTSFSGIVHAMRVALGGRQRLSVIDLGHESQRLRVQLKRRVGLGKRDPDLRHPRARARFERLIRQQLRDRHLDVLFAPVASVELGAVGGSLPAVYASDVTFRLLDGFYDHGYDAARVAYEEGLEQTAIARATRLLYPSRWAADSAVRDYGARESQIDIAQFGANLLQVPDPELLHREPSRGDLRLLFVGRDYARKGGEIALETTAALRARGYDARLTVVGCVPPRREPGVEVIAYLNKDDPAQAQRLRDLYHEAHVFLFPTRADCSPIALCEAAAFGLPAVCTDLAGIPDIVADGAGVLLPLSAGGDAYAIRIHELVEDPERYQELTAATRRAYDERLNWDAWAARAEASLRQAVADARG